MHNILLLNGPNLNIIGKRKPEIYGTIPFEDFFNNLKLQYRNKCTLKKYQSNSEGKLIDILQDYGFRDEWGLVFNPAAYTHTSIAIADCVEAIKNPIVEIHISDIEHREEFRRQSYLRPFVDHYIIGEGLSGYEKAIDYLIENFS